MDGNKLLSKCDCRYGAPLGRGIRGENPVGRVRLFRVILDNGGYDRGGAYWGLSGPLYAAFGDNFERYVWAANRDEAKNKLVAEIPTLEFQR